MLQHAQQRVRGAREEKGPAAKEETKNGGHWPVSARRALAQAGGSLVLEWKVRQGKARQGKARQVRQRRHATPRHAAPRHDILDRRRKATRTEPNQNQNQNKKSLPVSVFRANHHLAASPSLPPSLQTTLNSKPPTNQQHRRHLQGQPSTDTHQGLCTTCCILLDTSEATRW
jgi:hypothetical protein